jgi:hypothetical protein
MIKKIFIILLMLIGISVHAETLQAGVSKVDMLPDDFFGSWRVVAKIDKQSGSIYFKPKTVDLWNLSKHGNVINLNNPFTGASASVKLDYVEGNIIRFTKTGNYDNKLLTDTVDLKLNGDTFTGINTLKLETYSTYDNSLIKTDTALYVLRGEKISGSLNEERE